MPMMKVTLFALVLALWAPALVAEARGRFQRGQALVQERCAPCLSMGWVWAPSAVDPAKPHDLATYARDWSPARVCTFMRRPTRKVEDPGCYPGRISERDRLDMLHYLHRRAQGPIVRPNLRGPSSHRRYTGRPLKRTLARRRETAEKRHRDRLELEKMRQRSRSTSGRVTPPARPAAARPSNRGGR